MNRPLGGQIAELLLREEAVVLRPSKPFRFASGILSPIYCDNRLLLSNVSGRRLIVTALSEMIVGSKADQIAGVATAGIAWGAWVADQLQIPFAYVRGVPKDHGKQNRIEGKIQKGSSTALVEDLVSTGGSLLNAAMAMKEEGVALTGAFAIFSYEFAEAREALEREQISLQTLVNLDTLLATAERLSQIGPKEIESILSWRENPRAWEPGGR